jgi:hypothetical protein
VWLTTNYDDLILRALRSANRSPRVGVAQWRPANVFWDHSPYDVSGFEPSAEQPLVFYLHGRFEDPASMVITESDYLEYLEQMSASKMGESLTSAPVLPKIVEEAIASTSLLFIGYSFGDVNLHLQLRRWRIPRQAYAVTPLPDRGTEEQRQAYADYYPEYLERVTGAKFKMYWGTAVEFCEELDERVGAAP